MEIEPTIEEKICDCFVQTVTRRQTIFREGIHDAAPIVASLDDRLMSIGRISQGAAVSSKPGPLVIIDGHNLFIRNYVVSTMMTTDGIRCGGTVGTLASVKKLLGDLSPSNILFVWDGEGGSQRRKAIYSSYKEGRTIRLNKREDDMEEDPDKSLENMRKQRQDAADMLSLLGIPQVRADGVEADDLMAYVAGKMDHPGGCIIVTTDKDLLQLIRERSVEHLDDCGERIIAENEDHVIQKSGVCVCPETSAVQILSPIKKTMYDTKRFMAEHRGIPPANYRLIKALTGDKSDNIEGIKGLGEATIVKMLPALVERLTTPKELMEQIEALAVVEEGKKPSAIQALAKRVVEQKDRFWENLSLVDLSEPMLSAKAARQAREAMRRDLGCRELDFRIRLNREGISFNDERLVAPFREFVIRRRKFLKETEEQNVQVEQQLQDTESEE